MNRLLVFNWIVPLRAAPLTRVALGAACFLLFQNYPLLASQQGAQDEKHSISRNSLAEKVTASIKTITGEKSPAIVRIRCTDGHGEIVGTGFYIDPTGTICTLAEIVQGAHDITIEQDGKIVPLSLVALDKRSGVAFLKATEQTGANTFLSPESMSNAPALTPVIGIGYPREQRATPSLGMITGSKSHEGDFYFCVTHLIASIPLSDGEGGTPVLDLSGNLLGIVISGNTQSGLCTILPSAAIEQLHHNLLRYGKLTQGWVGAVVEFAAVPQQNSRTRVTSIDPGSPAEAAGLQPGDTLLTLGTRPVHTPEDVLEASFYLTAGEAIRMKILRDGNPRTVTLVCGERPTADEELTTNNASEPTASLGELGH